MAASLPLQCMGVCLIIAVELVIMHAPCEELPHQVQAHPWASWLPQPCGTARQHPGLSPLYTITPGLLAKLITELLLVSAERQPLCVMNQFVHAGSAQHLCSRSSLANAQSRTQCTPPKHSREVAVGLLAVGLCDACCHSNPTCLPSAAH